MKGKTKAAGLLPGIEALGRKRFEPEKRGQDGKWVQVTGR